MIGAVIPLPKGWEHFRGEKDISKPLGKRVI